MSRPSTPCAKCGGPAFVGGSPPIGGVRYCRRNPECRSAKRAEQRKRAREREDRGPFISARVDNLESRPCSSCGARMPVRAKRKYDEVEGRWCRQLRCQKHKRDTLRGADMSAEMRLSEAIRDEEVAKLIMEAPQVTCSACGRGNAPEGWGHPNPDFSKGCLGPTMDWNPPRIGARLIVWPSLAKAAR